MSKKIIKRSIKESKPGINVGIAYTKLNEKNNALKCSEDTIKRTEIQGIIVSSIRKGKTKEEIMQDLCKNDRYKQYSMYFEEWISNKMKKVKNREERQK